MPLRQVDVHRSPNGAIRRIEVNRCRGARRTAVRLVEVDFGRPNVAVGPEQLNRRRTTTGHARTHEIGTISLTGEAAETQSAGNPIVIERGVLVGVDLKHPSTHHDVTGVELTTRVAAWLSLVGIPFRRQRRTIEVSHVFLREASECRGARGSVARRLRTIRRTYWVVQAGRRSGRRIGSGRRGRIGRSRRGRIGRSRLRRGGGCRGPRGRRRRRATRRRRRVRCGRPGMPTARGPRQLAKAQRRRQRRFEVRPIRGIALREARR